VNCAGRDARRRAVDRQDLILVIPVFLSRGGVQALNDFVVVQPGKDVQFAADQGRAGIGLADGHLPLLVEFLGPGFGRREIGDFVVPIWPAPLRPILCGRASAEGDQNQAGSERNHASGILHSVSFVGITKRHHTIFTLLLASKSGSALI
jgi:hypothetical protein